jgi:hypothetical protein
MGPLPPPSVNGVCDSEIVKIEPAGALLTGTAIEPASSANDGSGIVPPPDGQAAIELIGCGDG